MGSPQSEQGVEWMRMLNHRNRPLAQRNRACVKHPGCLKQPGCCHTCSSSARARPGTARPPDGGIPFLCANAADAVAPSGVIPAEAAQGIEVLQQPRDVARGEAGCLPPCRRRRASRNARSDWPMSHRWARAASTVRSPHVMTAAVVPAAEKGCSAWARGSVKPVSSWASSSLGKKTSVCASRASMFGQWSLASGSTTSSTVAHTGLASLTKQSRQASCARPWQSADSRRRKDLACVTKSSGMSSARSAPLAPITDEVAIFATHVDDERAGSAGAGHAPDVPRIDALGGERLNDELAKRVLPHAAEDAHADIEPGQIDGRVGGAAADLQRQAVGAQAPARPPPASDRWEHTGDPPRGCLRRNNRRVWCSSMLPLVAVLAVLMRICDCCVTERSVVTAGVPMPAIGEQFHGRGSGASARPSMMQDAGCRMRKRGPEPGKKGAGDAATIEMHRPKWSSRSAR